jgi:hypothetical protein
MIAKASKNIILQAAQFLRKTHKTTARQLAGRVFWNGRLQIGCSMYLGTRPRRNALRSSAKSRQTLRAFGQFPLCLE